MASKILLTFCLFLSCLSLQSQNYTFPDETETHEGTWLQWPHQYEYGIAYRNENDATWVAMTSAIQANEKVHIIAYNSTEQTRITNLLTAASVPMTNVDFRIFQTNDVWVRDNGPIYARNSAGDLILQDWGFNGWGGDYNFAKDNPIPSSIAASTGITLVNLNNVLVNEGGSWELDGAGTFLATKSAILSQSNPPNIYSIRNPGKTQAQVEAILTQYIGATKFVWLDGWFSQDDITDAHIDGFAKFAPGNKLVTMSQADLLYWGAPQADINTLFAASNANNVVFTKVYVPLTQNNVSKTNGTSLGYKGSYVNYYVANNRVLVPNYNDPNDVVANNIIGALYPGRTVVGIDVRNLYGNGGMVHCVTQQQPPATALPIVLSSFEANCDDEGNTLLHWDTQLEINNDHFEIEKSEDGLNFTAIGTVKGNANSSTTQHYGYKDQNTRTKSYYRLKQVDINQTYEYSDIVTVPCDDITEQVILPNPSSSFIEIAGISEITKVEIFTFTGQMVMTTTTYEPNSKISIANLPVGMYTITTTDHKSGITQSHKFVKN